MLLGGLFVSLFAAFGDVVKPKRFAGLFGAAPSIALASLALTARTQGKALAAREAHSMILGGLAFFFYASGVCMLLARGKFSGLTATLLLLPLWLVISLTGWFFFLR